MEKTFKEIDVNSYNFDCAATFKKTDRIEAHEMRIATEEQETVTIIDGKEETRNQTEIGDVIVTGPKGEEYEIERDKFGKLYEPDPENPGDFRSKGTVQGILLTEDVSFEAPWGEQMYIEAGGVLVKNGDDIYGIEEDVFIDTYGRADKEGNVFASLDEPLIEQRAKATSLGDMSHMHDIEEWKSLANDRILEDELELDVGIERYSDYAER